MRYVFLVFAILCVGIAWVLVPQPVVFTARENPFKNMPDKVKTYDYVDDHQTDEVHLMGENASIHGSATIHEKSTVQTQKSAFIAGDIQAPLYVNSGEYVGVSWPLWLQSDLYIYGGDVSICPLIPFKKRIHIAKGLTWRYSWLVCGRAFYPDH